MTAETPYNPIAHLLGGWKRLALLAVVGAIGGGAYAFLAPKWYAATLTVVQSQRSHEGLGAGLAGKIPLGIDSISTDVQRIQAVLTSNSVTDEVIDRFKLMERYDVSHREQAREQLWKHCASTADRKAGVVSLTCEDKVPEMAKSIATYFGEVGNRVFGRVSASSAREERKFLESQVAKARQEVDQSSQALRDFQQKHKVIDLPEQSKATISAMASIQGEMISKQLELSYLSRFSSSTESSVVQLRQQIAIMQAKLTELETQQGVTQQPTAGSGSRTAGGSDAEFFPNAMTVPGLRFELEQLLRKQKIDETLFFLLTQRYEMVKVDEARDTSTFQILDYPTLPSYKSRPRRLRIIAIGMVLGLVLAAASILLPPQLRRLSSMR